MVGLEAGAEPIFPAAAVTPQTGAHLPNTTLHLSPPAEFSRKYMACGTRKDFRTYIFLPPVLKCSLPELLPPHLTPIPIHCFPLVCHSWDVSSQVRCWLSCHPLPCPHPFLHNASCEFRRGLILQVLPLAPVWSPSGTLKEEVNVKKNSLCKYYVSLENLQHSFIIIFV